MKFVTSTTDIEAISSLIPIHLHIKKLYDRFYFRGFSLLLNHIIKSIINIKGPNNQTKHHLSINSLMPKQILCLNSPLINMNNRCNEFLPSFSLFNKEISSGNHLSDIFSDHFFNSHIYNVHNQLCKLNNIII